MLKKISAAMVLIVTFFVIYINNAVSEISSIKTATDYANEVVLSGGVFKFMSGIYTSYMKYDTLLEAVLLLGSVIAVIYLTVQDEVTY